MPLPIVQKLAGHTNIGTTMRYVHLNDADVVAAMKKADEEQTRHTSGHTDQSAPLDAGTDNSAIN